MLLAVLRDALRIPGLEVTTVWNAQLERFPVEGVAFQLAHSAAEEIELLSELAAWCDHTLLIAPEFDGILTHRALLVEGVGGRLCGPNPLAITHCSDKLHLAEIWQAAGVPTIFTREFHPQRPDFGELMYPMVVKPRDGAGSQETYLVRSQQELERLLPAWQRSSLLRQAVWQPYVSGRAASVAVLVTPEQYRYEPLLPCEQTLSDDGRFAYLGGVIPGRDLPAAALQATAAAACRSVPGLRGYVGVDLIVPDDRPQEPLAVEINPRLTTSYLGYSHLCEQNLVARWLDAESIDLTWKPEQIEFGADGTVRQS